MHVTLLESFVNLVLTGATMPVVISNWASVSIITGTHLHWVWHTGTHMQFYLAFGIGNRACCSFSLLDEFRHRPTTGIVVCSQHAPPRPAKAHEAVVVPPPILGCSYLSEQLLTGVFGISSLAHIRVQS